MTKKTALITGITGQDGAYLSRWLLKQGYKVAGLVRRSSSFTMGRIEQLLAKTPFNVRDIAVHFGDMTDPGSLSRVLELVKPDEVYNLAAQSHVRVSFDAPEYTSDVNGLGVLHLLESIRRLGMTQTRFYQASTSELFGAVRETPQNEKTPFAPRSPYAIAKLFAYWTTVNYRQAYKMFAANGILFNHESPLRGESFVTRKITKAAARIKLGLEKILLLGNLDAKRDWGHAEDYVVGMWSILQQEKADDFVLATGKTHRVRDFARLVFERAGFDLVWEGTGSDEIGIDRKTGRILIAINPEYYRPAEVDLLCGDASKARRKLRWKPRHTLESLIDDMFEHDLKPAEIESALHR